MTDLDLLLRDQSAKPSDVNAFFTKLDSTSKSSRTEASRLVLMTMPPKVLDMADSWDAEADAYEIDS